MLELMLIALAVDYGRDVHPILAAKCLSCHSTEKRFAGLSVATHGDLLKGGKSGRVVDPGSSGESLLVRRIIADGVPVMPPAGPRLTANEVAAIRRWIDDGARMQEGGERARGAWAPRMTLTKPDASSADVILERYWKAKGIVPPPAVGDAAFARRAYLDVWGLLPTPEQLEQFVRSTGAGKRTRLMETLLAHKRNYAEHWVTFWNDHLRNDEGVNYAGTRKSITDWLLGALETNLPFDQFTRALLNPAAKSDPDGFLVGVNWRGEVNASQTPVMQAAQNSAQVFLGVNLKCNSCHDSFINKWKLADAYGLANFFSDERLEIVRCDASTGKWSEPKFLYPELGGVAESAKPAERREAAARLFTAAGNGRFARTVVNRYWKRLIGRGIVEPADDMDAEPWSPELLDWLAADFVEHNYDLKHLIARIMLTRAYALPSGPADGDFRGPSPRRLTAEQYLDALSAITGEWRPRVSANARTAEQSREWHLPGSPLSRGLGRPIRDQVFTERNEEATTLQALELVNGDAYTKFLRRAARKMLGEIPPPPRNLFDSGRVSANRVDADIDLTGVRQLRLIVVDVDSYSPERVLPVWAQARWAGAEGETRVAPEAVAVKFKEAAFPDGVRTGGLGKGPVEIVYDIAGKGYTRFRATVGVEESALASDISPRIRFFAFAAKPDMDRLVALDRQAPVDPPRGPWTVTSLTDRVFRHALGRPPSAAERAVAASLLGKSIRAEGLADLLWAVAALPEFRLL